MVEVDPSEFPLLSEAVVVWTGWGRTSMPSRDDSLLVGRLGVELAAKLGPVIKALQEDFYSSNACSVAADLPEMRRLAVQDFKAKYPQIPDEIAQAFAWCYTFDYK